MFKFLFVCYNHGAGGENLAVRLSAHEKFTTLAHDMMGDRTWSYDVFEKLFLKPFDADWKNKVKDIEQNDLIDVIPSHYSPTTLRQYFPDELYVVINYPTSPQAFKSYKDGIYNKVWLSKHKTLQQKVGYWKTNTIKPITRENLKALNQDITNGEIECLINELPNTEQNIKKIFESKFLQAKERFSYVEDEKLLVIRYEDLNDISGLQADINDRLT